MFPFSFYHISWKYKMKKKTGDDSASNVDDDEEPSPSCGDYIMHFLTLIWKIIFAFIPPTGKSFVYFFFITFYNLGIYLLHSRKNVLLEENLWKIKF